MGASEATCSTTTLTGGAVSCSNTAYTGPSRRRRQADKIDSGELTASSITVPVSESCSADQVCLSQNGRNEAETEDTTEAPKEPATEKPTEKTTTTAGALQTTAAFATLTCLMLLN